MKIVNPEDLRTSAAPVVSCEPESRAEAQLNIDHKKLMLTGKDVQKRGTIVILTFAGRRDPGERSIALGHQTGKAAKTTQTLVRRELRERARDDSSYNRVLQRVLDEIRAEENPIAPTIMAPATAESIGEEVEAAHKLHLSNKATGLILPEPSALMKIVHLHQCNAPSAGQCSYDWSWHDTKTADGSDCFCKPGVDDTNLPIDGTRFVIHESDEDYAK